MYHSNTIFAYFILFLVVQKTISDNYVNAEEHNITYGLKNYNNNRDKLILCDQCIPVIIVGCLQNYTMCENIICSDKACQSCFKVQCPESSIEHQNVNPENRLESDESSFYEHNTSEVVSSEQNILSQELHDPAVVKTQHLDNGSEELNAPIYNSSEQSFVAKSRKKNQYDDNSHNSNIFVFEHLHPVAKYICYILGIIVGMTLVVIQIHPLFSDSDEAVIMASKRYANTSPVTAGNGVCVPMSVIRLHDDSPPPSYEQCMQVQIERDEPQLQAESVTRA